MTRISEIGDEVHRERLRGELLAIVDGRAGESAESFSRVCTYLGIVYTGSAAAALGLLTKYDGVVPKFAKIGCILLFLCLVGFAICLHLHSQLAAKRYSRMSKAADSFFQNEMHLEDVIANISADQSKWLFRVLFWVPLAVYVAGAAVIAIGSL